MMPFQSNTTDAVTRGGLVIVGMFFFATAFLLTLGAEYLVTRIGQNVPASTALVATPAQDLILPQPQFAPEKVVALQLERLAETDPSTGIQQCFAFASPGNKQATGPLPRFAAMVQRPPFDVLLHRHLLLIGKPVIEEGVATVMVTVLDEHDEIRVFQFRLSKQHGESIEDCWMTDGVYPLQQLTKPIPVESPTVWNGPADDGSNHPAWRWSRHG